MVAAVLWLVWEMDGTDTCGDGTEMRDESKGVL
jgi:hypothetical protein